MSRTKKGHDMWKAIHSQLLSLGVNKSETEVKKKWDNLTQSYRKCVDKQGKSTGPSGSASSGRKKRKFMFYDEMHRINSNRQTSTTSNQPTSPSNSAVISSTPGQTTGNRTDEFTEDDVSDIEPKRARLSSSPTSSIVQVLYEWIEEERAIQKREHEMKMKLLETVIEKLREH
jgi:hypothetical protein